MKVIELLNRIANKEELPNKIRFNNIEWNRVYGEKNVCYIDEYDNDFFLHFFRNNLDFTLNDEVEIIEEDKKIEENKGIEGLWMASSGLHSGEMSNGYEEENLKDIVKHNFNVVHNKINEIIIVLNEMREDK